MGLCDIPGPSLVCDAVRGGVQGVAGSAFDAVVQAFTRGLESIMHELLSFWTRVPAPQVVGADGSSPSPPLAALLGFTGPVTAGAAVLGLVVAGARLAVSARGGESARAIGRGLLVMVLVAGSGVAIVHVLLDASDVFCRAVLDRAGLSGDQFATSLQPLTHLPGGAELGGGLVFLLALFGILASLVQLAVMIARGAVVVVLVGVLPVAAASSSTELGFSWFKKLWGWLFAFILYKPAAAIVYASAFALIGTSDDLLGVVSGYMLIILSVFALPSLLRLIPPVVLGGGSGGGAAAAGALATGAVMLGGRAKTGGAAPTHPPGLQPPGPASAAPALPAGGGPSGSTQTAAPTGGGPNPSGGPGGPAGGSARGGGGAGSGGAPAAARGAAGSGAAAGAGAAAAGPVMAVGAGLQAVSAVRRVGEQTAEGAVGDGGGV